MFWTLKHKTRQCGSKQHGEPAHHPIQAGPARHIAASTHAGEREAAFPTIRPYPGRSLMLQWSFNVRSPHLNPRRPHLIFTRGFLSPLPARDGASLVGGIHPPRKHTNLPVIRFRIGDSSRLIAPTPVSTARGPLCSSPSVRSLACMHGRAAENHSVVFGTPRNGQKGALRATFPT